MHKFTDAKGTSWGLELNGYTVKKVKQDCGVFLTDLPNLEDGERSLLARMFTAPYVLFIEVLWSLCEEQADAAQVSEQEFARRMGGHTLEKAREALTAAVGDFFISHDQREGLPSLMEKTMRAAQLIEARAVSAIRQLDPDLLAKSITDSSWKPAESAESTPIAAS